MCLADVCGDRCKGRCGLCEVLCWRPPLLGLRRPRPAAGEHGKRLNAGSAVHGSTAGLQEELLGRSPRTRSRAQKLWLCVALEGLAAPADADGVGSHPQL